MMRCFLLLSICLILFSCNKEEKDNYFEGMIHEYLLPIKEHVSFTEEITLNGIYAGQMVVYDTLAIFSSHQHPDYFMFAFSLNSKNLVGSFCKKGVGPNEFISLDHKSQFFVDNGDLKLWIDDVNNQKKYLLNLTKSIANNQSIFDEIIPIRWNSIYMGPFTGSFILNNNQILARNQPEFLAQGEEKYLMPEYHLYEINSQDELNELQTFQLYNTPIQPQNEILKAYTENGRTYFGSYDMIKPDNSKIAMAMSFLSQLNILDVPVNNLVGYRDAKSVKFDDLNTLNLEEIKKCFIGICVDNSYIYCLYSGAHPQENKLISNNVHIYDWDGNCLYNISLEHETGCISVYDKKLYIKNEEDRIFCYDLNPILNKR